MRGLLPFDGFSVIRRWIISSVMLRLYTKTMCLYPRWILRIKKISMKLPVICPGLPRIRSVFLMKTEFCPCPLRKRNRRRKRWWPSLHPPWTFQLCLPPPVQCERDQRRRHQGRLERRDSDDYTAETPTGNWKSTPSYPDWLKMMYKIFLEYWKVYSCFLSGRYSPGTVHLWNRSW